MEVTTRKPRVLVFEWLVGGGLLADSQSLESCSSMFRQGAEMLQAISEDFAAAGCEVVTTNDCRWPVGAVTGQATPVHIGEELPEILRTLADKSDFLFVIAPESESRLLRVLDWLEPYQDRLLSPGRQWAKLFSDKQASCDWLQSVGIRVPSGQSWFAKRDPWPPSIALPAVCKPLDGCGGEGIKLVEKEWEAECVVAFDQVRVESFVDGLPLSVVAIIGPYGHLLLQPTRQRFSEGAFGVYVGGEMIEDKKVAAAVWRAVEPAIKAMKGLCGIVGFDLILGHEAEELGSRRGQETCAERLEGRGQPSCGGGYQMASNESRTEHLNRAGEPAVTVIEVNPRLTSSYLGLRQYYANNLADCLLRLFRGECMVGLPHREERAKSSWRIQ